MPYITINPYSSGWYSGPADTSTTFTIDTSGTNSTSGSIWGNSWNAPIAPVVARGAAPSSPVETTEERVEPESFCMTDEDSVVEANIRDGLPEFHQRDINHLSNEALVDCYRKARILPARFREKIRALIRARGIRLPEDY